MRLEDWQLTEDYVDRNFRAALIADLTEPVEPADPQATVVCAPCGSSPAPTPTTPNHTVQSPGRPAQGGRRVRSEKGLRWGGRPPATDAA